LQNLTEQKQKERLRFTVGVSTSLSRSVKKKLQDFCRGKIFKRNAIFYMSLNSFYFIQFLFFVFDLSKLALYFVRDTTFIKNVQMFVCCSGVVLNLPPTGCAYPPGVGLEPV